MIGDRLKPEQGLNNHRQQLGPPWAAFGLLGSELQEHDYGLPRRRWSRAFARPSVFRRSGLPVQVMRPKRGWMLSCVRGRGWLAPLLSESHALPSVNGARILTP
jgi:hypothetical protein